MNGLSNLDESYKKYLTAHPDDLIRFWRLKVKCQGHSKPSTLKCMKYTVSMKPIGNTNSPPLMIWLDFGGQRSRSHQAVEVANTSTSTLSVEVHFLVVDWLNGPATCGRPLLGHSHASRSLNID